MTAIDPQFVAARRHEPALSTRAPHAWRARPAGRLSMAERAWLQRPGALTAGLRGLGAVELRVTAEFSTGLTPDESRALKRPVGSPVWVREVMMAINGHDCVSARSVTPLAASHGVWSGMRRLRTRPLADMLYGDPEIRRSAFEWRQLVLGDPFWRAVRQRGLPGPRTAATRDMRAVADLPFGANRPTCRPPGRENARPRLLARRSVFWRAGQPLLVAECFLPRFWTIANAAAACVRTRPSAPKPAI